MRGIHSTEDRVPTKLMCVRVYDALLARGDVYMGLLTGWHSREHLVGQAMLFKSCMMRTKHSYNTWFSVKEMSVDGPFITMPTQCTNWELLQRSTGDAWDSRCIDSVNSPYAIMNFECANSRYFSAYCEARTEAQRDTVRDAGGLQSLRPQDLDP